MIRLVIVDDDVLIRESLKVILGTYEGIEVVGACSNGKECIDTVCKQEVDVILLDMRMPVMDGLEVLKYMKMQGLYEKGIKVLVLTT
ncbi:MAG: response regulator, partial [Cellulosilyticaceae bacterium]